MGGRAGGKKGKMDGTTRRGMAICDDVQMLRWVAPPDPSDGKVKNGTQTMDRSCADRAWDQSRWLRASTAALG